jgi:hypothetical protein
MSDKTNRGISNLANVIPDVPDAPTVSAANVGTSRAYNNGAATVTITPTTGGLPSSYSITTTPTTTTTVATSSPATITGLASATSYTATVTPTNVSATGPATTSSSFTATTVPQAPTIGTATDAGTGTSVTVAYTAGATGGAAVSTFTATSSPGSLTGTGASPITVSGLTTGTAYTFTVTATNANGTSTASAASNSVIPVVPSAFESIATATPSSASTVTFSSIPSTYTHLQVRYLIRTTSGGNYVSLRLNDDTGSNYAYHSLMGDGSTTIARGTTAANFIEVMEDFNEGTVASPSPNVGIIDIHDYASTTKNKTVRAFVGGDNNSTVTTRGNVHLASGLWLSTSAVNSLTIFSQQQWAFSTVFSLYGIKGA